MKPRTLQYKKKQIDECIQEGWEIIRTYDEEFRRMKAKLGDKSGPEVASMLEVPMDEAMNEWLEEVEKKLRPFWGKRSWADFFGKECTFMNDYIDKLYAFEKTLEEQESEAEEKLILIDTTYAKVIYLKNKKEIELYDTDYWKYLQILVESDGEKVEYADILAQFPHKAGEGTKPRVCGVLKDNLLKKLLELGMSKQDLEKIIIVKKSHQLDRKFVEIR